MKNLILVSSPLQALSAIESIKYFNLVNHEIIIFNNTDKVYDSIVSIFNQFKIINFQRVKYKNFGSLLKQYLKNRFDNSLKLSKKIFIGDFEDISQLMFASNYMNSKTQIIFIDDGNKTILGYTNNFKITKIIRHFTLGWRVKYFIFDVFVNHKQIRKNSSVFSIFPLRTNKNINFTKNNMTFFKRSIISSEFTKGIYIIGSPLAELSLIETTLYIKGIEYIIKKHKNAPVFYIPHRRELMGKFECLFENENFNWIENKTNIELYFINKQIYPKFVYGFGSSALFTIKELFKKTEIVNLSFDLLNNFALNHSKKSKAKIKSEYQILEDYYTSFGIKKISLTSENKEFLQS